MQHAQLAHCTRIHFPLYPIMHRMPDAIADIKGSSDHPEISGMVSFYQTESGVIVYSEIAGLPDAGESQFFGFHIHGGSSCSGNAEDAFADALAHYDPDGRTHPGHAGDLPPLLSDNGTALSVFLTDRFDTREILGRTIIIHDRPDDFVTQPSGNAGAKIACGVIRPCYNIDIDI